MRTFLLRDPAAVSQFKRSGVLRRDSATIYRCLYDQISENVRNHAGPLWFLYEKVYYVPVEKRTFRNIRIEILNMSGERIAFKDSKTPLKAVLHFQRVITH